MKIGLVGGSFNPPHQGHLYISMEARKRLKLDQIWWLPVKQNPLKAELNSDFDRRMLQCWELTKIYPHILIKNYEKRLSGNYTIDIVERIAKQYSKHQFFWIMGADNAVKFHLWHRWQEIIKLMSVIVLDRDNYWHLAVKSRMFLYCRKLKSNQNKCYFLKVKKCNISSTLIRGRL